MIRPLRRPGASARRLHLSLGAREALAGYTMILPWIIGFVVFSLGPIVAALYFSFTEYNVLAPPKFIGAQNYVRAVSRDPLFWQSLGNTVYYSGVSVPLGMVISFALACLLNTNKSAGAFNLYRTLIYLPYVVPSVAASVIWLWLLNNQLGIINYGLSFLGAPPVPWLVSAEWSKPALITSNLWWRIGSTVVIYLAALQTIPNELYEAAEVDGATAAHQLIYVTIPLTTPTILFTLVLGIIDSFQVFNAAFVMTNGGPLNSTLFYVLHIYNNAFRYFEMGYASALSWLLFVIIMALTILLFRGSRSWVHYEGEAS